MSLLIDTIYYHESGVVRTFCAGEEAPRTGWQTTPFEGVDYTPKDPFDHDGDGKPGGAPKGGNRKKR